MSFHVFPTEGQTDVHSGGDTQVDTLRLLHFQSLERRGRKSAKVLAMETAGVCHRLMSPHVTAVTPTSALGGQINPSMRICPYQNSRCASPSSNPSYCVLTFSSLEFNLS
ncbi:hypothetical protein EYF80_019190 [Liparis tanakae]|uniref:Uncharacterized protein n=1 Tax=Liparis tanakae TaxID=230148 RepID=A0A4Z2HXK8_9TELE|nr:hypothetical protein EYF80_019190 [Liparis tanakae]